MNLKQYLKKRKETSQEFSKRSGLSESTISKYLNKKRLPELIPAILIEDATKGEVTPRDLLKYYKSDKEDK
jgi:transcriptional regulator with XRE-family HTH domain